MKNENRKQQHYLRQDLSYSLTLMPNFTIKPIPNVPVTNSIGKLVRNGKVLIDEFITEIKSDKNLEPELGDLFAHFRTKANGGRLPEKRFRDLSKYWKKSPYQFYEVKTKHLRMYVLVDGGHFITIGGKKGDQDEDIKRVVQIVKDYAEFKNTKK